MQTLDAENWCKGESVHILFFEYSFNVLIEKKNLKPGTSFIYETIYYSIISDIAVKISE